MKHKCGFCNKGDLYFIVNSTEGEYPNIYAVAGLYACDKCGKVSVLGIKEFRKENKEKIRKNKLMNEALFRIMEDDEKRKDYVSKGYCRCGADTTRQMNPFSPYFLMNVCGFCNNPKNKCLCNTLKNRDGLQ